MAEQASGNNTQDKVGERPTGDSFEDSKAEQPSDNGISDILDLENFFSQRGSFRAFELMVEDKSIFVNAHYLAQLSPFFAALCFDDFKEKKEQKAVIGDEKYEDFVTFIGCIHPSDRACEPVTGTLSVDIMIRNDSALFADVLAPALFKCK